MADKTCNVAGCNNLRYIHVTKKVSDEKLEDYKQAYLICEIDGAPLVELAEDLGVSAWTIASRVKAYKQIQNNGSVTRSSVYCKEHVNNRDPATKTKTKRVARNPKKHIPKKQLHDDGSAWVKAMEKEIRGKNG